MKTGRGGKRGEKSTGWSGGNPSGFRAKHVLAVRMYAARVAWLHGAPRWEPDGEIAYAAADGTRVSLTPEAIARAQYCLNRISVHTFSARAALGDADAYLARSRAALEVAKRLVAVRHAARRPGQGATADPATLASLLLLEAESIRDTPFSPARLLALLPSSPAAVAAPLRALVGDESLPLRARALAALVMGARQARRGSGGDDFAASETKAARHPAAAVRAAFAFALRRGLTDEPALMAALLAAADPDAPAGALLSLAERLADARRAVEGTPFALSASLLHELLRREGSGNRSAAERCVALVEGSAEMLPLAARVRRRRHELPLPPARENAQHAQEARGVRGRAVADLGALLTAYVRATGGDPEVPSLFAGFVRDTLDRLPDLLGPHLDAALIQPLRAAAKESEGVARGYLRLLNECGGRFREDMPGLAAPGKGKAGHLVERVGAAWEMSGWLSRVYIPRFTRALLLLKAADGDPCLVREALEVNGLGRVDLCTDDTDGMAERYAWIFRAARALGVNDLAETWGPWALLETVADDGAEARARFGTALGIVATLPAPAAAPLIEALSDEIGDDRASRRAALARLSRILPDLIRDTGRTAGLGEYEWRVLLYAALRFPPACVDAVRQRVLREGEPIWRGDEAWRSAARLKLALDVALALGCVVRDEEAEPASCDSTAFTSVLDAVRAARVADEDNADETDVRRGLEVLSGIPTLRSILLALAPVQAHRCLRLLGGLGAVAHLGSGDDALAPFAALEEGTGEPILGVAADDPEWAALLDLAPDLAPTAAAYWYARWLLGQDADVPAGVRRAALDETEKRRRELAHLEARVAAGDADPGIVARAASLRERMADGDGRQRARAADEARERLAAVTREAQMAAAERLLEECWRARLRVFLGRATTKPVVFTDDLRNALVIGTRIDENRKLLQRLLRAHLAGAARAFLDEHPKNREFRLRLEAHGADVDAWQGAHPRRLRLPGTERPVRLYVETDPLRVLQMGNAFGTCLGADGFNAFSTVANACEANKRVVYAVDDNTGRIVGRELLGLTDDLKLLRFRVYTNVDTPAEAEALDAAFRRYVADFAARCRLATADTGTVPRLFARDWYDDGAHPWEAGTATRVRESSLRLATARRTMPV